MPGIYRDPELGPIIADLARRVRALETQEQGVITNAHGQPVIIMGAIVHADGSLYYGIHLHDASGNPRAALATVSGSDSVDLQTVDPVGNVESIWPTLTAAVAGTAGITSTSYVASGGPSVTLPIGSAGKALVTATVTIATPSSGVGGSVGLYVDSSFVATLLTTVNGGSSMTNTSTAVYLASGLTGGASHTFELRYEVSSGAGTVNFSNRSLFVRSTDI